MRGLVVTRDKKKYRPIRGASLELDFAFGTQVPTSQDIMKFNYAMVGAGITNQKALLLVQNASLIRRILELPLLSEDKLLYYIQLNSKDYFPMDIEDYIIHGKVIQKQKDTVVVAVTLISKAQIEKYKETLRFLGLKQVELVYDFELPEEIKPEEDSYLSLALLGDQIHIQYTHRGEVVYSKGEEVEDIAFDTSGVLVRCDDYLTNHYGKNVYTLPVVVLGTQEDRAIVRGILEETFNNTVEEKEVENQKVSIYEYGYLGRLNTTLKKGKHNKSHIYFPRESKVIFKNLLVNLSLIIGTFSICMGIFYIGQTMPKSDMAIKTSVYENLVVLEEEYSKSNEMITNDTDYKTIVTSMDTYNNHFFTLMEELKKSMPMEFIISSISVSETGVDLKVLLDSMEACGVALEKMDSLKCAIPGDVTAITEVGGIYSFSISLQYTSAMKSER